MRALLVGAPAATFSETPPRPIDRVIYEMLNSVSSRRVSRAVALSVPAVLRGRNLVCSLSTLPLIQRGPDNRVRPSRLLRQIDPDVANVVTLAQTFEDLLCESIAWWEIIAWDGDDFPISCRRRDPSSVSLVPPNTPKSPAPLPSGQDPRGASVWVDGREVPYKRIIRFDSPNPPLLTAGARAIRRAVLLDAAAAMYADEPRPMDYFTPTEGADPVDDDEVEEILADWKAKRKERSTAYVPAALKYNTVDTPNPQQLQLVELQRQVWLEIANAIGLDPEDLGVSTTSRTYQNAIDRRRDRINDMLSPYMRAMTDRLSMDDVTRRGSAVEFDLDDYLRADPKTRWEVYEIGQRMGAITNEEIRMEEKLGPMPPGARRQPAPAPVSAVPAPGVDADADATWAEFTRTAQFADERPLQFADVPVMEFKVDRERRIIEGLALPYGSTASKYGLRFRFVKGALKWTSVNRVKLLRDHNMTQPLGVATNLTDTTSGMRVRFKVARGDEGDRALALAEDGVLDGFSVGVDFDASTDAVMDDDGVMVVHRADLREVSLTAMPAYDDARVTKVAASRAEEGKMPEDTTTEPQTAAPAADPAVAPGGIQLSSDQLQALFSRPGAFQALLAQPQHATPPPAQAAPAGGLTLSADQVDSLIKSGGLGVLLGMPQVTPAPRTAPEEKRQTVNPTVIQASHVREELPYRFDRGGNLTKGTQYDFSTDLFAFATSGDNAAYERVMGFIKAQSALFEDYETALPTLQSAKFDTATTDVAALNPNRQRPDLYVDQKDFQYPIWEAISKGTLGDIVPFVLPKFSAASGMVANHTEGVEPSAGTYQATAQTITPSAVSGKMVINREAWDAGGNPQLSGIVWRQMVKSWYEALEAAAVTLLDSLSPTQITLATGAVDDVLVGELKAALAGLQFIRGGFRMRDFFLQIDLYKALVDAKDADGRDLLPRLGPMNATGTVSDLYGDLDIGGLRGRPGWALAASGTVAASSYLFDRNDVHGWASAPNRLQFEYQVKSVEIGIWGYKALANTDITGVREVVYDPQ